MVVLRTAETKWSFGVFFLAAAYVFWNCGSRFVLSNNDEGIYLSAAMRMLHGEIPYRDFFIYVGPGCPLFAAGWMRAFGETLWAARIPLSIDLGVMTACVFWTVARLASRHAAILAAFCFLAFETAQHDRLVADHRWDSSAAATLALALLIGLLDDSSRWLAALAGACAALAAWITPPVAVVALVVAGSAIVAARLRPLLVWMFAGAAAVSIAFAAWLAVHSAWRPAMDALLWPAWHYAAANRTPYGWVIGGYANVLRGEGGGTAAITLVFLFFLTLPATLPIFSGVVWPLRLARHPKEPRAAVLILLSGAAAMVISTIPRPDLIHLMYVAPAAYSLGAIFAARSFGKRSSIAAALIFLVAAASEYGIAVRRRLEDKSIETRVGTVRGTASDLEFFQFASRVPASASLFAFPYWPSFYFITGAHNPTRYFYLQPGMSSDADQRSVLAELQQSPPDWILYFDGRPEDYLRMWPASDPSRLRMTRIEDFIAARYRRIDRHGDLYLLAPSGGVK